MHTRDKAWVNLASAMIVILFIACTSVTAYSAEYCFGAAGQGCGSFGGGPLGSVATCVPVLPSNGKDLVCEVSGGSMLHDPCCVQNPYGEFCGKSPSNSQCSSQWNRAVHRFIWGYDWVRFVDSKKENTTGNVVRADYCAKNGHKVHRNDRDFCCSGRSTKASFWDRIARPSLYMCTS